MESGFKIAVSSTFEGWWRYNVALMCGCFDNKDQRTGFSATELHTAEVGTNLKKRPAEIADNRCAELQTEPCDHIVLYIYIVPHTLPTAKEIADTEPFKVNIRITHGKREVWVETRTVNQWSGASIELKIDSK